MGYNKLGGSADALARALLLNTTLVSLNLRGNLLGGARSGSIINAIGSNKTLTSLDLSYNRMGRVQSDTILHAITSTPSLTSLDLSSCFLNEATGRALVEALRVNTTLRSLVLKNSALFIDSEAPIGPMLTANSTLELLDLENTGIEPTSCMGIALALTTNSTLTSLNISHHTRFGDTCGVALAQALRVNDTLTSLDLAYTSIGGETGTAFANMLKDKWTMMSLTLLDGSSYGDPNDIPEQTLCEIENLIDRNLRNWERKAPLLELCSRELVRIILSSQPTALKKEIYEELGLTIAESEEDLQFEERDAFSWSKLIKVVNTRKIDLGSRVIEQFSLEGDPAMTISRMFSDDTKRPYV